MYLPQKQRWTCSECKDLIIRISFGLGCLAAYFAPYLLAEWLLSVAKVILVLRKFLKWSFSS